jgi:hypothetical protein
MAVKNQTINLKRSATPSAVPTTGQLALGEIAINTYDGKLYIKKDNGTPAVVQIGATGATGATGSTGATGASGPVLGTRAGTATASTSTTSIDVSSYDNVRITLTSSTTLTLTGASDGQRIVLELIQDSTGSRILTLGSSFRLGTDITSVVLSTTASKTDKIGVIYNSAASKYDVVAFVKGF